jgi:CheY-like chemotaxis protein
MPETVLLVDDNHAFRDLARRILTGWGHEVIEVGTAAEAVARAHEERVSVALVDIGLPDGNGFDLARRLVGVPWGIRVILMSTDSDAGNLHAAQRVGACGFFPKDELLSPDLQRLLAGD